MGSQTLNLDASDELLDQLDEGLNSARECLSVDSNTVSLDEGPSLCHPPLELPTSQPGSAEHEQMSNRTRSFQRGANTNHELQLPSSPAGETLILDGSDHSLIEEPNDAVTEVQPELKGDVVKSSEECLSLGSNTVNLDASADPSICNSPLELPIAQPTPLVEDESTCSQTKPLRTGGSSGYEPPSVRSKTLILDRSDSSLVQSRDATMTVEESDDEEPDDGVRPTEEGRSQGSDTISLAIANDDSPCTPSCEGVREGEGDFCGTGSIDSPMNASQVEDSAPTRQRQTQPRILHLVRLPLLLVVLGATVLLSTRLTSLWSEGNSMDSTVTSDHPVALLEADSIAAPEEAPQEFSTNDDSLANSELAGQPNVQLTELEVAVDSPVPDSMTTPETITVTDGETEIQAKIERQHQADRVRAGSSEAADTADHVPVTDDQFPTTNPREFSQTSSKVDQQVDSESNVPNQAQGLPDNSGSDPGYAPVETSVGPNSGLGNTLQLHNPIQTQGPVNFNVDRSSRNLAAGQSLELNGDSPWLIEFHRGGDFGIARHKLGSGSYRFQVTERGWDIHRDETVADQAGPPASVDHEGVSVIQMD
jgi:hypothetical protein